MSRLSDCLFKVLKSEIEFKWDSIKCKDIYNMMYIDFWEALRKETRSAGGFTGLSEVIIFLILKKLIEKEYGGKLDCHEYTKDTYYLSNLKFAIGRDLTINIGRGKTKVDIAIWKNPSRDLKRKILDKAIEIKLYTVEESKKTVKKVIDRLKPIRTVKSSFRGMLIFYKTPSKLNEVKELLEKEKDWFDCLILEDNSENFVEILRDWLAK